MKRKWASSLISICRTYLLLSVALTSQVAVAHNKVVVVPLFGEAAKSISNVITVAKSGGDFSNPVAAINSITDATFDNPYLVIIGPGEYTLATPLIMKRHVNISGSGLNITRLVGDISDSLEENAALIHGAGSSRLTDHSIDNTSLGNKTIGILNQNASGMVMKRLDIKVRRGVSNTGIWNKSSSTDGMIDVTINVSGGGTNTAVGTTGIRNSNSGNGTYVRIKVRADTGGSSTGIFNTDSSQRISNSSIQGVGISSSFGVFNNGNSNPTINDSRIFGQFVFANGGGSRTRLIDRQPC